MRSFIILIACLVFFSCEQNRCDDPSTLIIETNSPVYVGWDLHLETNNVSQGRYKWYGPNGWKQEYDIYSSEARQQTITPVSLQSSGEYTVKVYDQQNCVTHEGKVTVEITEPPQPPCNITANTSQTSIIGIGGFNFTSRTFEPGGDFYTVFGTSGPSYFMRFAFYGGNRPKPGKYALSGFFGLDYGTTGLFLQNGPHQYIAQDGFAYVNVLSNGKLSISICNIKFSNPVNANMPVTMSAKITEP